MTRCSLAIPHRYAKNLQGNAIKNERVTVSIPHRYAKNEQPVSGKGYQGDVSIPHRYAKNPLEFKKIGIVYLNSIGLFVLYPNTKKG